MKKNKLLITGSSGFVGKHLSKYLENYNFELILLNRKELDLSYFDFYHFDKKPNFYNEKLVKLFGKPRQKNKQISKRHFQIAGALQRAFEQIVLHLIYITKKLGGQGVLLEVVERILMFQNRYKEVMKIMEKDKF